MGLLKRLLCSFRLGGLTKAEMEMCVPEIKKRNVENLRWILLVMLCGVLALSIVSFIPGTGEEPNRGLYLFFTALVLAEHIACKLYFSKHPEKILLLSYIFMLTAYAFGIYEAVGLGADASSTLFCVFLVMVPLLVIDIPLRLAGLSIIVEIILLAAYFAVGNRLGDRFVVINSLSCTILGICCGYVIQKTKLSDIRNHLMLEVQRDTDMMTGARSRAAYVRDIEVMSGHGISAGVVFADVNGLKKANDTCGHAAGDRLIKNAFALMLRHFNGENDSIYRIGGDEFVVICLGEEKESFEARCAVLARDGGDKKIISAGSIWLERVRDAETAVREAEKLMYADKERFYKSHPEMDRRVR